MHLPKSLRSQLLEDLDDFLEASDPGPEALVGLIVESLEAFADEFGLDEDIVVGLEESGELDAPLVEALEAELESNEELTTTGEELVSLLEQLCGIDWIDDAEFDDEDEPEYDDAELDDGEDDFFD